MGGRLTVISWRDIPAQVTARAGDQTVRKVLDPRFQTAIDAAAMKARKSDFDDYVGEWRRADEPCDDDVEAAVAARAAGLEAEYTDAVLDRLVAGGGLRTPEP